MKAINNTRPTIGDTWFINMDTANILTVFIKRTNVIKAEGLNGKKNNPTKINPNRLRTIYFVDLLVDPLKIILIINKILIISTMVKILFNAIIKLVHISGLYGWQLANIRISHDVNNCFKWVKKFNT